MLKVVIGDLHLIWTQSDYAQRVEEKQAFDKKNHQKCVCTSLIRKGILLRNPWVVRNTICLPLF